MNDYQRSRVYRWEGECVHPYDNSQVDFNNIQSIVNYVWSNEELEHPPTVTSLPKQAKTICGRAKRTKLEFHANQSVKSSVILHELAHSLTSYHKDEGEVTERHGPKFVGMFIYLLDKYTHLGMCYLLYSTKKFKVNYEFRTKAVFAD